VKAHLLWRDGDVDFTVTTTHASINVEGPEASPRAQALMQDLQLQPVLDAMAQGDPALREVARRVMLDSLDDPAAIRYRQDVLADCMRNETVVRQMLAVATEAVTLDRKLTWWFKTPEAVLRRSVEALQLFVGLLRRLRAVADDHGESFASEGFTTLFASLRRELSDDYFAQVEEHLERLRFPDGVLISAHLGPGLKPSRYVLRSGPPARVPLKERLRLEPQTEYHWDLPPRDEAGSRALSELNGQAISMVAEAASQSARHISSFFVMLWIELAFYAACLNLLAHLRGLNRRVCFPEPQPPDSGKLHFQELGDTGLAIKNVAVVGNSADADGKPLVMITGANSGGKSTFLRSVGIAQVMMQAGMFVTAEAFTASAARRLFTHFIRDEDPTMTRGKLDEELNRMSAIADELIPGSLVLFNESFAATNEREGSEIAGQIVRALLDGGVRVLFVTHQYTLADALHYDLVHPKLFLRAERTPDGERTFKLVEGPPLRTSFGEDLYRRIGGWRSTPSGDGPRPAGAAGVDRRSRQAADGKAGTIP
jgi:hypothetical protein